MKVNSVIVAFATIFVAAVWADHLGPAPNTPDFTCSPGESFKYDCNTCHCGTDGKTAACTLKACLPHKRDQGSQTTCEPGTTFKQDCNTCTCLPDGTNAVCTLKACLKKRDVAPQPVCVDGVSEMQDCNSCTCFNGLWACTLMECVPEQKDIHKRDVSDESKSSEETKCVNGEKKTIACNDCTCSGGEWACTRMICPEGGLTVKTKRDTSDESNSSEENKCSVEGEQKEIACNTCTCGGGEWACTRRICPEGGFTVKTKRDVPEENKCSVDGEVKEIACNTCRCGGGQWACTRRICPDGGLTIKTKREEPKCEDGEHTKIDCNMCTCIRGDWACTKRRCVQPPTQTKEKRDVSDDVNCKEGSEIQQDCNTCHCIPNKGYACTKKLCPVQPNVET